MDYTSRTDQSQADGQSSPTVATDDDGLDILDIQSVMSEQDFRSLDVVMRMMGDMELSQIDNEVWKGI